MYFVLSFNFIGNILQFEFHILIPLHQRVEIKVFDVHHDASRILRGNDAI